MSFCESRGLPLPIGGTENLSYSEGGDLPISIYRLCRIWGDDCPVYLIVQDGYFQQFGSIGDRPSSLTLHPSIIGAGV